MLVVQSRPMSGTPHCFPIIMYFPKPTQVCRICFPTHAPLQHTMLRQGKDVRTPIINNFDCKMWLCIDNNLFTGTRARNGNFIILLCNIRLMQIEKVILICLWNPLWWVRNSRIVLSPLESKKRTEIFLYAQGQPIQSPNLILKLKSHHWAMNLNSCKFYSDSVYIAF